MAQAPAVTPEGEPWPQDAVEVGRVLDAWGIKGGVRIAPFSAQPQALFGTKRWFLLPPAARSEVQPVRGPSASTGLPVLAAPKFVKVRQAREQGDAVVATLDGVDDRNAAEALKGARVFVSRTAFPTPDEGEFYWIDLIGLEVFNPQSQSLGRVVDLLDTGAHCVLKCLPSTPDLAAAVATPLAEPSHDPDGPRAKRRKAAPAAASQAQAPERLIPFVGAYILQVDVAGGRILADWGLDY